MKLTGQEICALAAARNPSAWCTPTTRQDSWQTDVLPPNQKYDHATPPTEPDPIDTARKRYEDSLATAWRNAT